MKDLAWKQPSGWFTVYPGWIFIRHNKALDKARKGYKVVPVLGDAYKKIKEYNKKSMNIIDLYHCDIEVLVAILKSSNVSGNLSVNDLKIVSKVLKHRIKLNNVSEEDERELFEAEKVKFSGTIKLPTKEDLLETKLVIKKGLKFRWPFQRILKLPTQEQQVNTPCYTNKTSDNIEITYDVDYEYRIVDPIKFGEKFSDSWNVGADKIPDPTGDLESKISTDIENYIRSFIKNTDSKIVMKFNGHSDLINYLIFELRSLVDKYGILVTNLYFKTLKLPQVILDQQAKLASIAAENEIRIEKARAEKELAEIEYEKQQINNKTMRERAAEVETIIQNGNIKDDYSKALIIDSLLKSVTGNDSETRRPLEIKNIDGEPMDSDGKPKTKIK